MVYITIPIYWWWKVVFHILWGCVIAIWGEIGYCPCANSFSSLSPVYVWQCDTAVTGRQLHCKWANLNALLKSLHTNTYNDIMMTRCMNYCKEFALYLDAQPFLWELIISQLLMWLLDWLGTNFLLENFISEIIILYLHCTQNSTITTHTCKKWLIWKETAVFEDVMHIMWHSYSCM